MYMIIQQISHLDSLWSSVIWHAGDWRWWVGSIDHRLCLQHFLVAGGSAVKRNFGLFAGNSSEILLRIGAFLQEGPNWRLSDPGVTECAPNSAFGDVTEWRPKQYQCHISMASNWRALARPAIVTLPGKLTGATVAMEGRKKVRKPPRLCFRSFSGILEWRLHASCGSAYQLMWSPH